MKYRTTPYILEKDGVYYSFQSEDEIGCACCDMAMKANDFCSLAERREVTT